MKTTEFMFRFPGNGNEQLRYSVIVVHGVSVTFIRIGASQRPFSLMVPRVHDETFAHARAEDLARLAIAQAIYEELFAAHPEDTVDLEVHGPLWDGDLDAGQWQHGMAEVGADRDFEPGGSVNPAAPPLARQFAEDKPANAANVANAAKPTEPVSEPSGVAATS